jgi:diketogulonate reductase-like aldo/keto reductase
VSIGLTAIHSNVHHLEELKEEGLETPTVNQIEVGELDESSLMHVFLTISQLHPFCQQRPIVDYCNANGIIVQAYSPLVQGRAGKIDHPTIVEIAQKVRRSNFR